MSTSSKKTTIFLDNNGELYKYFAEPPTENLLKSGVSIPEPKSTDESR